MDTPPDESGTPPEADAPTEQTSAVSETPAAPAPEADGSPSDPDVSDPVVLADQGPVDDAPVIPIDPTSSDDPLVQEFNGLVALWREAASYPSDKPEAFKPAARLALQIVKMVITTPRVPVLDAALHFFEDELTGPRGASGFMLGSTTLSKGDEQTVGVFNGLFTDLAMAVRVKLDQTMLLRVLKKPEFFNYYQRKINVLAPQA